MNICYIIGALPSAGERFFADDTDLVVAADAGWQTAEGYGLIPALAVGDFDTAPPPDHIPIITHPVRKDDTDLMLAVRIGLQRGYRTFVLAGATGGRPDHTFAAYQTLRFLKDHGARGYLTGEGAVITLLSSEELTVSAEAGTTFSLFANGGDAKGVTIRGAAYPLENGRLTESFPLGVSNAFTSEPLIVSTGRGNLLMMTLCPPERSSDLIAVMAAGRQAILPLSGVIFDMDGTLIDSNPRWDQVGFRYLERYGLTAPEDFLYHVHTKPVPEIAVYLKETFGLEVDPDALTREVISLMDDYYRTEATPKAGVLAFIRRLEGAGIPYCIATAAERSHVEAGLATVGITGQKFILTCTEVGADKRFPTVFEEALRLLGSDRATTAVVEDSPTALATAGRAGFYTVSVYDNTFRDREEEKRQIADLSVRSLEELASVELRKI
ncbi:MAG: thiamine diphosphokinase [Clostridia bacterium]|nr:thiamine diphosphokinase [Clostridia bacterium]